MRRLYVNKATSRLGCLLITLFLLGCRRESHKDSDKRTIECALSPGEFYGNPDSVHSTWFFPEDTGGVVVWRVSVHEKRPMYKCGLRTGDVIEFVNSVAVGNLLPEHLKGDTTRLSVRRDAERFEVIIRAPGRDTQADPP